MCPKWRFSARQASGELTIAVRRRCGFDGSVNRYTRTAWL